MNERLVVVLRLTEACNLSCGFCAYDRRLDRARVSADAERVRAFGRMLAEYARAHERRVLVSFLGGEPLLWPDLERVEAEFGELGLELGVTTNGTALASPAVRERMQGRYTELTVSIDGLGGLHDQLRGWRGGFEHLKSALLELARLERERGHGPLLRVNTVLMRDNVASFAALCRELAGWGVAEVTFNQLGGSDRPEFHAQHRLLPEQIENLRRELPRLRDELSALGLSLRGGHDYLERFAASAAGRKLPIADCAPGDRFWFASERLTLAPCSFGASTYGVALEELQGSPALFQLAARFRELRATRHLGACDDCPSTQVFAKYAE